MNSVATDAIRVCVCSDGDFVQLVMLRHIGIEPAF